MGSFKANYSGLLYVQRVSRGKRTRAAGGLKRQVMKTNMGNTGSKKVAEMDELIRTQAEAGNRFAQLDLGMLYLSNGKVSSEHEKASLI